MQGKKGKKMGLTDAELVEKYEKGAIPLHKHVKKLLRKPNKPTKKKA